MANWGVGKRIRELRLGRGWTQAKLAETARLTADGVSRIELGSSPKLETVLKITDALDVWPGDLFKDPDSDRMAPDGHLGVIQKALTQTDPAVLLRMLPAILDTIQSGSASGQSSSPHVTCTSCGSDDLGHVCHACGHEQMIEP